MTHKEYFKQFIDLHFGTGLKIPRKLNASS